MSANSPNRAAGHFHFRLHAKPGSVLTLEFKNLDNVYNGRPGSVANELKAAVVSRTAETWKPVPLERLPGDRVRLTVTMPGPELYVARVEPYRLSDLEKWLASIRANPWSRSRRSAKRPRGARWKSSGSAGRKHRIACSCGHGPTPGSPAATGSSRAWWTAC